METEEYKGYQIEIEPEDDPENPRDWDNLGTMVCWHRHYRLGDERGYRNSWTGKRSYEGMEVEQFLKRKDILWLPLFLYDHGGITMSTTAFTCPWDSGMVGFIYVTKEDILKEYGGKIVTKKKKELVLNVLRAEVKTYDQYLTGDVWWYNVIDPDGNDIHSCGGFFGHKFCLEEAKGDVDYDIKRKEKEGWEKVPVTEVVF